MSPKVELSKVNDVLHGFHKDQAVNEYEWLWEDEALADIELHLTDGAEDASAVDASAVGSQATTSSRREQASDSSGTPACSRTHSCSYLLHAAVLCSNSAYFRARFTSGVGAPSTSVGSKRSRLESQAPTCASISETILADELDAASALVRFFYTKRVHVHEDIACQADLLLQMMKVRMRCGLGTFNAATTGQPVHACKEQWFSD